MAFSEINEFHVNGLASIYVFTGGNYLGYSSEAGVQLDIDPKFLPIYTDALGDQVPEDVQNMGMIATLNFELIRWDQTVLAALQSHLPGAAGNQVGTCETSGVLGASPQVNSGGNNIIGTLLKQSGWTFPLMISRGGSNNQNVACETNKEGPYVFTTCYVGPDSFNLGTRNTRHRLSINCIPNSSGVLFFIGSVI